MKILLVTARFGPDVVGAAEEHATACAAVLAQQHAVEVATTTALNYFDGFRNARLPANLLQAQRDFFGAHQYERIDQPRGKFFHTNWTGRGGTTASTAYVV